MKRIRTLSLGAGAALAALALPPEAANAQKARVAPVVATSQATPTSAPIVVVAPTAQGADVFRSILERDFDYGNRLTPLVLDASFFAPNAPGNLLNGAAPNYPLFAKLKVRALVIPRREGAGLRVAYHDVRASRLVQDAFFPLPDVPASRAAELRDSVVRAHAAKQSATQDAIARAIYVRDSLTVAMRVKPMRDPKRQAAAMAKWDSLRAARVAEEADLRTQTRLDLADRDAAIPAVIARDSASRDSLQYIRRMAIHGISDEVTKWITGQRGYARSRIVYVQKGALRVVDSDGANDRALTDSGYALSPSWHPSGNRVVYSDLSDTGTQIAQVDVWTHRVALVGSTPRGLNLTPAYTPDGRRIVYSTGGEHPAELVVADANSKSPARTFHPGTSGTSSPTFSPDGARLAYISPRPWQGKGENARSTPQIFTMNADGTGEVQLTPTFAGVRTYRTSPDWSPDGTRVAYMQQHGDFQLWTIGVRDRKMKKLTSVGENEDPSWSPDSRHLAFTSNRGGAKEIWVLDTQSGRYRQLTFRGGGARLAAWSKPFDTTIAVAPTRPSTVTVAAQGQQ